MEEYSEKIRFHVIEGQLCGIMYCKSLEKANFIATDIGMKCEIHEEEEEDIGFSHSIRWNSEDAYELANKLNENDLLPDQYEWLFPDVSFQYQKIDPRAKAPKKAHVMDSGYDITCIDVKKVDDTTNTWYLHTGLKIRPPFGFYFELYPRSSISKSGFMLANSIGVIDANYRGELIVAVKKVVPSAELPSLPWKVAQIIPKSFCHMNPEEVDDLDETQRNEEGFGSTGN